jgi:diguanylate cyclase (GGDEF)-like protein/PAS domain S-box-containing protein
LLGLLVSGTEDFALCLLDVSGNVIAWNRGAQQLEGYAPQEIIGRNFSALFAPEAVAAGTPSRELAVAAAHGRADYDGWQVRPDATRFWASVSLVALRHADGTLRGYGKITRDESTRRAADEALRSSEERFRCCFDEARLGMLIISLDGELENVNEAFCAMIGYTREQLIGTTRSAVTHPDDLDADGTVRAAMLRGETSSRTFEKRYLHASGRIVWVAIYLTLIRDDRGEPMRWIAQVQDVTQRRSYERKLEYMADHDSLTGLLNRRSFERGMEIHLARVARFGAKGAVLMVDLDNFKIFNDTWGHRAGDQLLARIARGLQARVQPNELLARLGGDEFAAILPDADNARAEAVAEAFLNVVRDEASPAGQDWVSASIGLANFSERMSAEGILVCADLAMYDAKAGGGDRWAWRVTTPA